MKFVKITIIFALVTILTLVSVTNSFEEMSFKNPKNNGKKSGTVKLHDAKNAQPKVLDIKTATEKHNARRRRRRHRNTASNKPDNTNKPKQQNLDIPAVPVPQKRRDKETKPKPKEKEKEKSLEMPTLPPMAKKRVTKKHKTMRIPLIENPRVTKQSSNSKKSKKRQTRTGYMGISLKNKVQFMTVASRMAEISRSLGFNSGNQNNSNQNDGNSRNEPAHEESTTNQFGNIQSQGPIRVRR